MIRSIVLCVLPFVALPLIYGKMWETDIAKDGIVFTYVSGFLTILAIFECDGSFVYSDAYTGCY